MTDTQQANGDLRAFLERVGLGQYFDAMAREDLTLAMLRLLDDADLRELGMSMGHRKNLRHALAEDASAPAISQSEDQRRQVTIFFCDLVASTEIASRYDAEDMSEILARYHTYAADIIAQHGGRSLGTQGDGVVACFGYPKAAENDASRAVSAALAISEGLPRLRFDDGLVLHSRLGVATGRVFVRGNMEDSAALVGETLNLAARLQDAAETDSVVVGENTQKLIARVAEIEAMGARKLKGFDAPVPMWRVLGMRDIADTQTSAAGRVLGRDKEHAAITSLWETVKGGAGQALVLSGGAGIGKSTLLDAARRIAKEDHATVVRYYCAPGYENSALYPVRAEIARSAGLQDAKSAADVAAKLQAWTGKDDAATIRMVADLVSLDPGPDFPPLDMTATEQKGATYTLLLAQLAAQAKAGPVLVILEDAHWADPTTLEFLTLFVAQGLSALPIFLMVSQRPSTALIAADFDHLHAMQLDRLGLDESRRIITRVMGDQVCPPDILHQIIEASDGIPLFLEELTRSVLDQTDSATGALSAVTVPITLEDSLMARLDRLSEGKTVVQTAAVFGRRFETEPLRQTLELEKVPFGKAIAEPVEARILVAEGEAQSDTMLFRHALVQQAAYEGLARRQRQQLHARIATLLLEHEPGLADTEPETLARHFAGAGKFAEAVTYLISAGKKATERAAQVEAANHYFAALSHLEKLPEGRERDSQEVLLRALLGGALMATRGFAAPEVYDTFARARALCIELGDSPMFCSCLYGLFTVAASRSNKDEAMALAAEMLATFGEVPVPSWQIAAHFANGVAHFFAGEFDAAEAHFGKAVEIYTPDQHGLLVEQFGDDLTEFSMCYQHWLHLLRGKIDDSVKVHAQVEAMANALKNKNAQARSIAFLMGRMLELEMADKVAELAPQVIEISTTQGYPYWACAGQIGLGWTMARAGHEDGLLPITGSLDFFDMIGQRNPQTFWRSSLIAAHTALGQRDAAIAAADTALEMSRSGLDCAFEALILLRRGQAEMLAPADPKAAEASLSQAIDLAGAQGAYLYGLLAATERAALLIDQGRAGDEGGILAQITAHIESSDDFPALTRAQDLLGQL